MRGFFNPGRVTLHIVLDKPQGIDYLSRFPVAGRVFVKRSQWRCR